MAKIKIKYISGYRHQLAEDYVVWLPNVHISPAIQTQYMSINKSRMIIKAGYAWDGPSGPCRFIADRLPGKLKELYLKSIMRGSLVHDALYQLIRMRLLPKTYRGIADKIFRGICKEDKMSRPRLWWVYYGVSLFAKSAADPKNKRRVRTAP